MKIQPCDDVVISGIGGKIGRSRNLEEFKKNLLSGEDLMDTARWKEGERGVPHKVGAMPEAAAFDAAYFGIHRVQTTFMDPMHRICLESAYEALLDAGTNPLEVRGRNIAVFTANAIGETDTICFEATVSGFGVTGHSRSMLANRVSYWLNLKGSSIAYDHNWIGGMEILRTAYEAIRDGKHEAALIATTNIFACSEVSYIYKEMGLLSPDGNTRSFDADANGYGRSEGVVVLFLQKARDARRSYASIVNVLTEFNGNREGKLLDVNPESLTKFLSGFYSNCPVDPKDVDFVEAYGSGIKYIDKVELESLDKVYCKDRKTPLMIGSVKSNTGHSEPSSVMFSIAKVLVAFESGIIPANRNFTKPNPEIAPLVDGRMEVVAKNEPWRGQYAAVNAFGFDSYYGHVLFRFNPKTKQEPKDKLPRLVVASTRTEDGIKEILNTIKSKPTVDPEYISLIHQFYAKPITGHLYRGYIVLDEEAPQEHTYYEGLKRPIWFVYSGMGSQWLGMGKDLMQLPIFANAIKKCQDILLPKGVDVIKILTDESDPNLFENILNSFVGIAAIQIGLTDVLKAIGVVPDGIIGHSVGELGCGYADGCLTAEQMILAAYARGKASLDAELIRGMMAAIGLGYNEIKDRCPPSIEVACHNGPGSSTISGPAEDMDVFVKQLQSEDIFARLVNVSNIAYHSRYIKPAAPLLFDALKNVIPNPTARSDKWISTSVPEKDWTSDLAKTCSAEYQTNNLLSSVLFEEGLVHIPKNAILIEIAPHGLLQAVLKRSLPAECTNISLTQRKNKNCLTFLLSALGKMYLEGIEMDLSVLYPQIEYPVGRGTAGLADLSHWEHSENWGICFADKQKILSRFTEMQVSKNSEDYRECVGNQIDHRIILPVTTYLLTVVKILHDKYELETDHVVFEDLKFRKVQTLPKNSFVPVNALIQLGTGYFEVLSHLDVIASGVIKLPQAKEQVFIDAKPINPSETTIVLSAEDVYDEFDHRAHNYSKKFKCIKSLSLHEKGSTSISQWESKWTLLLEAMIQQVLFLKGEKTQTPLVPQYIQKITISMPQLPKESQDVEVSYEYNTGIVSTEGMQICGIIAKPIELQQNVSIYSMKFDPLKSVSKTIEQVVINALHIVFENFENKSLHTIVLNEVNTADTLTQKIDNISLMHSNVFVERAVVDSVSKISIRITDPTLLIHNDYINNDLVNVVASSHAFLLVKTNKNIASYNNIVEIKQYTIGDEEYSLIRKSQNEAPYVVQVSPDVLSIKDLNGNKKWAADLRKTTSKTPKRPIFIISTVEPVEGIRNFAQELTSKHEFVSLRLLFIFDDKAPEFRTTEPFYQKIFKADLILTVIENGIVGLYTPEPTKFGHVTPAQQAISNIIDETDIRYLGINLFDETIVSTKEPTLGNINYSGYNKAGEKTMGLARWEPDSSKLLLDPILKWKIPDRHSVEDGATMPHPYVSVYYALQIKGQLVSGEKVLIHNGCSPIGQAAIRYAMFMNCEVYTTAATEVERTYIRNEFDQLSEHQVLSSENTTFVSYLLMATKGKGVNVVLNSLSGKLLQASMDCLAPFARFIQVGRQEMEENVKIGTKVFLRCISFSGIALEDVFSLPDEEKQKMQEFIQKGVSDLMVVRALRRKVFKEDVDIKGVLKFLETKPLNSTAVIQLSNRIPINRFHVTNPNKFLCSSSNTYFIHGGRAEERTELVEWVVRRGARKIVVSSEPGQLKPHLHRQLVLLEKQYNAEIIFSSCSIKTEEASNQLMTEIARLGPIHAVFTLSGNNMDDSKAVQHIDVALRKFAPKAFLVNFFAGASGICKLRSDAGYNAQNFQWDKTMKFREVIRVFDDCIAHRIRNVFIKNERNVSDQQESSQALYKKLQLLLPASVDEVKEDFLLGSDKPELLLIPSRGPPFIREIPPLFIIPGLMSRKIVHEMADQLLYPTFCVALPNKPMSLQELAKDLAQEFIKIYPGGPYNMVGISWGGVLAVEIAKILEDQGASSIISFVDGAPGIIQSVLKHIGEGTSVEVYILCKMLNITDLEVIKQLNSEPNWKSRLNLALNYSENKNEDKEIARSILSVMKHRLEMINTYKPTEPRLLAKTHLFRPTGSNKYDLCGLLEYFKEPPEIHVVQGDHLSIIKNKILVDLINEKVSIKYYQF